MYRLFGRGNLRFSLAMILLSAAAVWGVWVAWKPDSEDFLDQVYGSLLLMLVLIALASVVPATVFVYRRFRASRRHEN